MLWLVVSAALAGLSPQTPAGVGFFDSARLVETCAARDDAAKSKQSVCLGYIGGAVDQLMMQQAAGPGGRTVCMPAGLTLDAAVRAVLERSAWAVARKGFSAASFVQLAMEDAFPCRRDADIM